MREIVKINTIAKLIAVAILFLLSNYGVRAQTSEFTYQGKLNDSSVAANGTYDLSFKLYDGAGTVVGSAVLKNDVQVTDGYFAVSLDFGANSFDGTTRLLEISVRPGASTGSYTTLAPMQPVTSSPYAVRSLNATTADTATNATQLGGVSATQFVQTSDSRMTDARSPLPNSPSYIQNGTTAQASSNFNIVGNGTVGGMLSGNIISAATQYNIGSDRVLGLGYSNLFAGVHAGLNTPVNGTGGIANTFVGQSAGVYNVGGNSNSFFGDAAGYGTLASDNSFVGAHAGYRNTTGARNSFFGKFAGGQTIGGNITGPDNSLFGYDTGATLTTGGGNTLIGANANVGRGDVFMGTAIGNGAVVHQDNSVILGNLNARVGIGTGVPQNKLQILDPGNTGLRVQNNAAGGTVASFGPLGDFNIDGGVPGGRLSIQENGTVIMSPCPSCYVGVPDRLVVEGTERLLSLGAAGSLALCRNSINQISACSSSLRYKSDITPYRSGLDLVKRLDPIAFKWKADGMADLGLGAESVAKVEPLLVTHNDNGEVEGVKYDRVAVVLLNAVKEQQAQIDAEQKQIEGQRKHIEAQQKQIDEQRREIEMLQRRVGGVSRRVVRRR